MNIDVPEAGAVTVGFIGEPGSRTFYVQVWGNGELHSLKLEKQQVSALGGAITELLADVVVEEDVALPDVIDPGEPDWIVGTMGLTALDDNNERIFLILTELVREEDAESASEARIGLTIAQLAALGRRCEDSVTGGRPNCPLCGRPMNPEGHVCPKTNGSSKH